MRQSGSGVIAAYSLPPNPPAEVAEAAEHFNAVATKYAERQGEVQDAEEALEAARRQDHEAAVQAALEGKEPSDPGKHEREAAAKLEGLWQTLGALAEATDRAGDAMLGPITDGREAWIASFAPVLEEAAARYDAAIKEARKALEVLGKARSAVTWLEGYDAGAARVGLLSGYHGKPEVRQVESFRGQKHDPREILKLAAEVTAPPPLPYGDPRRAAEAEEVPA